jgi:hypothetical protein
MGDRLTSKRLPYAERSATIVWDELYKLGIRKRTILWNVLPMHPHQEEKTQSNRTPTSKELEIGKLALQMLVAAFPSAKVIAVGRKAQRSLQLAGVPAKYVRHPARGGEKRFRRELKEFVNG